MCFHCRSLIFYRRLSIIGFNYAYQYLMSSIYVHKKCLDRDFIGMFVQLKINLCIFYLCNVTYAQYFFFFPIHNYF